MVDNIKNFIETVDRKYGAWVFYVALVLMLTSTSWFWLDEIPGEIRLISKRSLQLGQTLCCLRIALLSWKYPRYVILCAVIIPLVYYSYLLSHGNMLIKTVMFVAASRDADIKVILRIYLVIFLTMLFLGPATLLLDWSADIVKHKYNHVGHSYGFYNPNRYAYLMQMLILLVIHILHIPLGCDRLLDIGSCGGLDDLEYNFGYCVVVLPACILLAQASYCSIFLARPFPVASDCSFHRACFLFRTFDRRIDFREPFQYPLFAF